MRAGREGGRKTRSNVAILPKWARNMEGSWDEEVAIRNQIITSVLARKDYL